MIKNILLVDDEDLFHLVFEDACSLLNISLSLEAMYSADEAARMFHQIKDLPDKKPEVVFCDLNIIGSSFNGIELVNKINHEYGNGVVIGMISSSCDEREIGKAMDAGAQFWIVKSDEIEPRLEKFKVDYSGYKNKYKDFEVYR